MLISCWFLSCIVISLQGVICSDLEQDPSSVNEKLSKQLPEETGTYKYHHPPLPGIDEQKESRIQKSINVNEQKPVPRRRTNSRGIRQKARSKASTPSLEIPVQVIYDTKSTTVRPTRIVVRRKQLNSDENKKIGIRQTTIETKDTDTANVTGNSEIFGGNEKSNVSPSTEFPKRSRGSYFKKRTEGPAPKVKILEEKNFVYAHSGNFHYSFLGDDGTKISSEGSLKSYDKNRTGEAVSGSVFYKGMDGNDYSLSYTADENGYRPIGAHLPTPPPLPPAIARALKYIADKSTPSTLDINE